MEFKLIIKKLNDTLSQSETEVFNEWYNEKTEHQNYFNDVKKNYGNKVVLVDVEKGWRRIAAKIDAPKRRKMYWRYTAAAIFIGLIATTYVFRNNISRTSLGASPTIVNTIVPGTDKATLTLEDGSVVVLEKGSSFQTNSANSNGKEIVYESTKRNATTVNYNYLSIPRGGQFFIKLSDGTQVWLNSESQLKYPVSFIEGETREVELVYGEAYFDVSPSTNHKGAKFKVISNAQEVEVLGTEFNIKAYKDEANIYTTLVEGKVEINTPNLKQLLIPNQQSVVDTLNDTLSVGTVDVKAVASWKEGVFSFKNKPLKDIMKVLSRWYDVDVVFENKALETVKFKGIIDKDQSIEEILAIMKSSAVNDYTIKNNTVILN